MLPCLQHGNSMLHLACYADQTATVMLLLDRSANIEAANEVDI